MSGANSSVLPLTGEIDIQTIQDCFEKVTRAFVPGETVAIDLSGVTALDITLLQLVLSLRRSAQEAGTSLRLRAAAPDCVLETLARGGFLSDPPDEVTRFWQAA
jgi:anti-anti-sigma regulatory factor